MGTVSKFAPVSQKLSLKSHPEARKASSELGHCEFYASDDDDPLAFYRGLFWASLLAVGFWGLVAWVLW